MCFISIEALLYITWCFFWHNITWCFFFSTKFCSKLKKHHGQKTTSRIKTSRIFSYITHIFMHIFINLASRNVSRCIFVNYTYLIHMYFYNINLTIFILQSSKTMAQSIRFRLYYVRNLEVWNKYFLNIEVIQ